MGRKQTGFDKDTLTTIGKHFAALVDYAKEKERLTALDVYTQIYGDDDTSNKEDKISKMKKGETITAYDVMKIQAWKNLSLDWLVLGKGNPPPELQETQKAKSCNAWPAPDTVCGFLWSFAYLSVAEYVRNMKIVIRDHEHAPDAHDIRISFSLDPSYEEGSSNDLWQCDTIEYLTYGIREISNLHLSEIRTSRITRNTFDAKVNLLNEIISSIPPKRNLLYYPVKEKTQKDNSPLQIPF